MTKPKNPASKRASKPQKAAALAQPEGREEARRNLPPVETRFKPGQSGNPGGMPKAIVEVRRAARDYTHEALERLAFWMRSDNAKASVSATVALINRGWGMPTQHVSTTVRNLKQMTDDELFAYLSGADEADGSEGAVAASGDPGKPH